MNTRRRAIKHQKRSGEKYKCPHCEKMKSHHKHCFCDDCRNSLDVLGYSQMSGNEVYG